MKRTIFILITTLLCMLWTLPEVRAAVNEREIAKTFVGLLGKDYWPLLRYDGYTIKNNNVDFYREGTYYITYQKDQSVLEINKTVVVLKESTLMTEGYYENRLDVIMMPSTLAKHPVTATSINDRQSVFIHTVYDDMNRELGASIVISMIEDGNIRWQTTLRRNAFGTILSLAWADGRIIGVGYLYNELTQNDGWLVEVDMDGKVLADVTFGGSGHDYFLHLAVTQGEYLLSCKTSSTDSEFIGPKKGFDTCLVVVDSESKVIRSVTNLGTESDDEPLGFLFNDNHYFMIQKTTGINLRTRIIKLALDGTMVKVNELAFPSNFNIIAMKQDADGDMFFLSNFYSYLYGEDVIALYRINDDVSIQEYDMYHYSGTSRIFGLDFAFLQTSEIAILYGLQEERPGGWEYGYAIKVKQGTTTSGYYENYTGSFYPRLCIISDNIGVLMANDKTNELGLAANNTLRVGSLGSTTIDGENVSVTAYDIMINNARVEHDPVQSHLEYNPEVFGVYQLDYYFDAPGLTLAYYINLYVDLNASVTTGTTYDTFTKVCFNGEGILNEQHVASSYVISAPGEYTLEVIGLDNIHKFVTFSVKNLSLNKETVANTKPVSGAPEVLSEETDAPSAVGFRTEEPVSAPVDLSTINNWFIAFPLASLLIICLSIFKRKYRR